MVHPARALMVLGWLALWLQPAVAQAAAAEFQAAESQFANQDYANAATAFEAFVRAHGDDPNAPQAAFRIAQCYGRLEQFDKAAEASAACAARYADSRYGDTALYNKGYYLLQARSWQPAAAAFFDYTKVGREPSYRALAWYWRAESLYNLTRYLDAVAAYGQFLAQPAEVLASETVAGMVPWAHYSTAVSYQAAGEYAKAVAAFDKLLATFGDHAQASEALYRQGLCHQSLKQIPEAVKAFEAVLDRHRASSQAPLAIYALIEIEQARGNAQRAEQLKNRLAAEYPDSADLLSGARFRLAKQKFEAGDYAAAEALYREALEGAEGDAEAIGLVGLAEAQYQQDHWADAEGTLTRLLERHPAHAMADHARLRLGDVYLLREKFAEAETLYRDCLKRGVPQPELVRVEHNLALAVRGLGRDDEALKLFWSAVEADPKAELSATVMLVIAQQTMAADPAQAERACRLLVEHHPRHDKLAQARFMLGQALEAQKKYDEAAAAYRDTADKHPTDPSTERALYQLAEVYRQLGQADKATAAEAELAQRFPASQLAGTVLLNQGFELFSGQKYSAAAQAYERFLREQPQHPSVPAALANLGACYYRATDVENHFRRAAAVYRRLADEHGEAPDAATALYWCGRSLQEAGDHAAAIDALQTYLRSKPDETYDLRARLKLGESLAALKRFDEAVNVYEAALHLNLSPADQAAARYELAWCLIESGKPDEGYRMLERVAADAPTSDPAAHARFALAGRLFAAARYDEAATAYRQWLEAWPQHALVGKATYNLAWALEEAGDFEAASATFAQAIERLPADSSERPLASVHRCRNLMLAGRLDEAEAALDAFDATQPVAERQAEAGLIRGQIAVAREDWDAAEARFRNVLDTFPNAATAPQARLALGKVLQNKEDFEAARAVYLPLTERPGDDKPLHAEALLHLGECYLSSKLVDEALDAFLRADAVGIAEVSLPARYWAGRCYQQQGEGARAREKFQRVINDSPASDWARRAKEALDELAG